MTAKITQSAPHSRWVPVGLWPKQVEFLEYDQYLGPNEVGECGYGGAAGGGKSVAQLARGLKYVDRPGYSALILRRSYQELALPGGLIPLSHAWLTGSGAKWSSETKQWRFPSGATLAFGHLDGPWDHLRYQSSEFQYCGFEELTQWPTLTPYLYLFSRLRKTYDNDVPLMMGSTTNPGGPGHDAYKERFLTNCESPRRFIPSKISDNPSLNEVQYRRSLAHLDPVTRERLMEGDWAISPTGMHFTAEMFEGCWYDSPPLNLTMKASGWDTAITQTGDWNARAFGYIWGRCLYLDDVVRFHADTPEIKAQIQAHAYSDGLCPVGIEQAVGSLSIMQDLKLEPAMRKVALWPCPIKGKSKLDRAQGWRSKLIAGDLKLRRGPWNDAFIEECLRFTNDTDVDTDDQIDAVTVWFETIYKFFGTQDAPGVPPAPGTEEFYEKQRKEREKLEDYGYDN